MATAIAARGRDEREPGPTSQPSTPREAARATNASVVGTYCRIIPRRLRRLRALLPKKKILGAQHVRVARVWRRRRCPALPMAADSTSHSYRAGGRGGAAAS